MAAGESNPEKKIDEVVVRCLKTGNGKLKTGK